jgi:flagellar motor switch protein FliN/FliY
MSSESNEIGQEDIDHILKRAQSAAASASGDAVSEPGADGNATLDQRELQTLLQSSGNAAGSASESDTAVASDPKASTARDTGPPVADRTTDDLDVLFRQATEALNSIDEPSDGMPPGLAPFELRDFSGTPASTEKASLDLLREVELDLKIELGRANLNLENVLRLRAGSVVPLDKLAGDPVDICVNGRLIARGEVLVLNDNFCVRVAELVAGEAVA